MKKSKILVPALAVLALGVAGASVGTVAWFQSSAQANAVDSSDKFTVKSSSIEQSNYYFRVKAQHTGDVEYTDKTGQGWCVVNGVMAKANAATKFGTITMTLEGFKDLECTKPANTEELKAVGTVNFTVALTASDQARITLVDPTADFAAAFGDYFENVINVAAKVENGVLTIGEDAEHLGTSLSVYYSVSGQANNVIPTVGASAEAETVSPTSRGAVAIDLE